MIKKLYVITKSSFFRYLAPLFLFLLIGCVQGSVQDPISIWVVYTIKIVAATLLFLALFRAHWHEIAGKIDVWSVVTGIVVLVVWLLHYKMFAGHVSASFDPTIFHSPAIAALAICIRVAGASIVTPVLEETIWRSFMMRYYIKEDFLSVPLGSYTFLSFWLTVLTFMAVHPMWQWGVAAFAGSAYGLYMVKSKSLTGCIVAHAVTNLGLSLYALLTHEWGLWG